MAVRIHNNSRLHQTHQYLLAASHVPSRTGSTAFLLLSSSLLLPKELSADCLVYNTQRELLHTHDSLLQQYFNPNHPFYIPLCNSTGLGHKVVGINENIGHCGTTSYLPHAFSADKNYPLNCGLHAMWGSHVSRPVA